MKEIAGRPKEGRLAILYSLTAGLGFLTDVTVLKIGMSLGLDAAWARALSLFCAMQTTFWVNALFVFRCREPRRWPMQWLRYMAGNGVGNLCNYLLFTTLLSLHRPILSNRWLAVGLGGLLAWVINYACARLLVFNTAKAARTARPA
jgi:putative flippase GtrA